MGNGLDHASIVLGIVAHEACDTAGRAATRRANSRVRTVTRPGTGVTRRPDNQAGRAGLVRAGPTVGQAKIGQGQNWPDFFGPKF